MSKNGSRTSLKNECTRVALIGLGEGARRIMLPALTKLPEVQLVAGCDLSATTREDAAKRWKIAKVYAEPEAMLDRERPDVVVIATPPLTHYDMCVLALERDCHIYCEKPFMPSVEEADRVIALAQKRNRVVAVNHQYSQMPIYQTVQLFLANGQAGRVYHIEAWQHMYLLPDEEGGWKAALQPRRVLFEFGTHPIDLMCRFFGAYPLAVSARMPRVRADVEADVCVIMRLDFPGDRVATMTLNRMSYMPVKYFEMRLDCERATLHTSYGGVAQLNLGWNSELSRPRFEFGLTKGGEARLIRNGQSRLLAQQPATAISQAAATHFSQFLTAVRTGAEPMVSARQAREILRILFAGYHSANKGGELVTLCHDENGTT